MAITVFIRYEIDPFKESVFERHARNSGQAIPRSGADLIGCFAPHEGRARSSTASTTSKASRPTKPIIRREDRLFLRLTSAPHAEPARADDRRSLRPLKCRRPPIWEERRTAGNGMFEKMRM